MKKIIAIFLFMSLSVFGWIAYGYAVENTSEDYIPSETIEEVIDITPDLPQRVETDNKEELKALKSECKSLRKAAKKMKESAEVLGCPGIVEIVNESIDQLTEDINYYSDCYDAIVEKEKQEEWNKKAEVYPAAAQVWKYFSDKGCNDYVCAGILGNIMAEVGGQTLNIKYRTLGRGYYGMCQWALRYSPKVLGRGLDGQCDYLANTIKREFDVYGSNYKGGFNYEQFLNLQNEQEAALAFAACYERCGSASYSQRKKNATTAYNYFAK